MHFMLAFSEINLISVKIIDDYTEDSGPGRSDLYVVFTIIICGLNFSVW